MGHRFGTVNMLRALHDGFCGDCWVGTVFCYGPRYPYLICLCQTWLTLGYVSRIFYVLLNCTVQLL